ncbi:MAG: DUF362 domain-containing protein [Candidatus Aureabacteria bacterium]|nr:DUF362 domain-containing protein [Candidatus Auribacterota bacterium]
MPALHSTVALVVCRSYEPALVRQAVGRAIGLLGGIDQIVRPGQRLLIKPNMLSAHPPEKAVTTHPALVEAVIEISRAAGVTVAVGDSPALYSLARVAAASGIAEAVARAGGRLAPFDEEEPMDTAPGCLMKKIVVAREVATADAIISIPKFKTHCLTHITGAIKNMLGCVPGLKKAEMHYRFPDNERFSRMLVDICRSLPVTLHLMDAVTGMDGDGPSAGTPFPIGLIIAGLDPVAVDSTACRVVGIDPLTVPMIRIGQECCLGHADGELIRIVDEPLNRARVHGFKLIKPRMEVGRLIPLPEFISRRLKNWIVKRPRVLPSLCTRCGACVEICPARPKALTLEKGRVRIQDHRCILCYCCSEICPSRATRLKRGFAAGLLAKVLGI